jgi:hypothetical protein
MKILYGKLKRYAGQIPRELCRYKGKVFTAIRNYWKKKYWSCSEISVSEQIPLKPKGA